MLRVLLLLCLQATVVCHLTSCTGKTHRKWADREVFGILRKKASKVPNSGTGLMSITPPPVPKLEHLEKNVKTADFLGEYAAVEKDAKVLPLSESLNFAVTRNRDYLTQKETLYLTALDLTLARNQYSPILTTIGNSSMRHQQVETSVNNFVRDSTLATQGTTNLTTLARTGTRLALDLSTDFVRFLTGNLRDVADSKFAVTLTQPLLKGAGVMAASEPLTQAERTTLYAIRDFTQYRKTFTVGAATAYYQTIQSRDAARNAYIAFTGFTKVIDREKGFVDAGLRTPSSLGLLLQAQLTYQRRWLSAVRGYQDFLDDLKIQIGLPISEKFILDQDELGKLKVIDPPGTLEEAVETAMATRLDLWNRKDELADAERRVKIAKQNLLPGLNLVLGSTIVSDPGSTGLNVDGRRRNITAGADVDLNLNQTPVRNDLVAAQIAEQASRRNLELAEESIRRQIRGAWRSLDLAKRQYDLALTAVSLSESRLQQEEAFSEEGRGTTRDLIDAQQDLIDARDLRTAAVIAHTTARLQLWRDMGILFIKKDGSWMDVLKNEPPRANPTAQPTD